MHFGTAAIYLQVLVFFFRLINGDAQQTKPCTYFEEKDTWFKQTTLIDLYKKSSEFFKINSVRKCGLHYIDFFDIQPPEGKENVWITYMGDSVMKELFIAAGVRFSGYEPLDLKEVNMDLTGVHLGPPEITSISEVRMISTDIHEHGESRYEKHPQYLLCCRANFRPSASGHVDDGDCILAVKRTPKHTEDDAEKHKMFVFDDIQTYVNDFVKPLFLNRFKCLSFLTAVDFEEAEYWVSKFADSSGDQVYPSGVIMNMGLHNFMDATDEPDELRGTIKTFMSTVDSGRAPIRYIMHSATSVRENDCRLNSCQNSKIEAYNAFVKNLLPSCKKMEAYLDIFNYSSSLGDLNGFYKTCQAADIPQNKCTCKRFDGIHFERICNYAPFMTQWDFNWLLYLNVISYARH
jgi:hypothetical protein